ncbi:rhodanese-like domain-containing protein [Thermosynechococcaceae cyanobacterium BACA0444]|uniref:Rhodanese-like domain-containing protein n=1 Tax=Pseudocalidococcus azoricus BACA0444 TaxID=2918990 RepID=A0AAE4FRD3_9CYAN|nr:rhodanese-like domain-containing protein [Pseudocalidococcus azoricus]MDS3859862.1 rhodanese-like domain-containing protein [Pseudocalidococcus azoricus BACA0444]
MVYGRGLEAVTVQDLEQQLASGNPVVQLVDVREPAELEIVAIPGFINLPLSQFEQWQTQISEILDPAKETWALCHHGIRSAQFCHWLKQQGYSHVKNITGGIDAYVDEIQPTWPHY